MEETGAADAARDASPASGLVVLVSMPTFMTLSARSLAKRRIVVPFVECSTRYVVFRFLSHRAC
jgi:hypothetical protein